MAMIVLVKWAYEVSATNPFWVAFQRINFDFIWYFYAWSVLWDLATIYSFNDCHSQIGKSFLYSRVVFSTQFHKLQTIFLGKFFAFTSVYFSLSLKVCFVTNHKYF